MHFSYPSGSFGLFAAIAITVLVGFGLMGLFTVVPAQWRRPIVAAFTFFAGAVYVAYYLWPQPMPAATGPDTLVTGTGKWLQSAIAASGDISQTLTTFLLGLGIWSLLSIHSRRVNRRQKDWGFSVVLLVSLFAMIGFGYVNYWATKFTPNGAMLAASPQSWGVTQYTYDFMFEGMLQQMDAAMFSIIAFYILSAAYRAFRIRSIEATILLATALVLMLSLLGAVALMWDQHVVYAVGKPHTFADNFTLGEVSKWIQSTPQGAGLRGLDFGIGLGALAMGLRLWLSLERGGITG